MSSMLLSCENVPVWQIPAHLFNLAKNRFPPWDCGYTTSCHCGLCLMDVVFTTLLLHTSHPYHRSSTAQQQVWLSSQTIRTVHITTHDRHKLSGAHQLIAYSDVPGALPGCQPASRDIKKGADPAHGFILNFCSSCKIKNLLQHVNPWHCAVYVHFSYTNAAWRCETWDSFIKWLGEPNQMQTLNSWNRWCSL